MQRVIRWAILAVGVLAVAGILVGLTATGVIGPGGDANNQGVSVQQPTTTPTATATARPPVAPAQAPSLPRTGGGVQPGTTATTTQQAVCPGDREVHPGETFQVPPGCNVKGDIEVNGRKLYDDDPTTGLIVSCPNGCTIFAQWGANVTPRGVDDLKAEMLSSGCESKCASVKVLTITDQCDVSLPKGAKVTVPGGCVVSGDVAVNGKTLYDSDQTTGLVVIVKSPVEVFAPFGASVTNADPQDVVDAVKQTGCGLPNGCRVVNTVTVP